NALSLYFYAIPSAKPLRTFAGIALAPFKAIEGKPICRKQGRSNRGHGRRALSPAIQSALALTRQHGATTTAHECRHKKAATKKAPADDAGALMSFRYVRGALTSRCAPSARCRECRPALRPNRRSRIARWLPSLRPLPAP